MSADPPAPPPYPRTTQALRHALEAHGFRPRKRHGQNFLTDPQAVDAIVRDAGVGPGDHVIEIGTGVGLLTHALAETGARVTGFEVDAEALRICERLRTWPDRVRFVLGDALEGKHALAPSLVEALDQRPSPSDGRLLVVSNLPYGAGTPILLLLLAHVPPPAELVVMLQREVAEKMLAQPGDSVYGAPSVLVGLKAEGRIVRRFGPEVFWPRPRVASAVLRLQPREGVDIGAAEHRPFGEFVTALFTRRRKILPKALRRAACDLDAAGAVDAVESLGLDARVRVQDVSPQALLQLFRRCSTRAQGGVGGD